MYGPDFRRHVLAWAALAWLVPGHARAQRHYTAEELRDLGRPVTAGAATLALGGTRGSGLGDAGDAAANPASLVLGPRRDAVISLGGFRYGRRELVRTESGDFFSDALVSVDGTPMPIGSGAVALRTSRVAVGATYDAVSRVDYGRSVDRLRWATPLQLLTDQRDWSVSVQHQRLGAAVGAVLPGDVLAIGGGIHAARTRIRYDGSGTSSQYYSIFDGLYYLDSVTEQQAHLDADAWGLGFTVGAMMRPQPGVDLSVRFVHEPRAQVVLAEESVSRSTRFTLGRETRAAVDRPDLVSAGATVHAGGFRIVGEVGALLASHTFRDAVADAPGACTDTVIQQERLVSRHATPCWQLVTAPRPGIAASTTGVDLRVGVERGWHRTRVSWWLRGGASREATAGLQTVAPVEAEFIPRDPHHSWAHAGGGLRLGRATVDVGVARWQRQYRVLVDVKLAAVGDAPTRFGIPR
jgi:hypothetical protein